MSSQARPLSTRRKAAVARFRVAVAVVLVCAVRSAAAEPRMLKGPYLQDLAPRSITVMWQLAPPSNATLTVEGPGGARSLTVGAAAIAEARIAALQPATRYRYTVTVGSKLWTGEFATAPLAGAEVPHSFVVFGDTRYNADAHRRVIERMAQEVPDFVLGTGDMVDQGHHQDEWQEFFDVEEVLLRDNVFFPALGNHDRQGRGRTADTYRAYFSVPENGSETERYYAFTYATSRFVILDSNEYSFALTDQTAWLERELIAARADPAIRHVFIVMHHPPYSISLHGGNQDLRERWVPLFEKYSVTAVFSGHDHVYSRAEVNGIHYFITGGGGAALYPRRAKSAPIDVAAIKKFERVYHYLRVMVTGTRVEVTGVRSDGTTIETTTWTEGAPPKSPDHPVARTLPAPTRIAAAGAPTGPVGTDGERPLVWLGIGGIALLLVTAVVVVRSLRR